MGNFVDSHNRRKTTFCQLDHWTKLFMARMVAAEMLTQINRCIHVDDLLITLENHDVDIAISIEGDFMILGNDKLRQVAKEISAKF